MQRGSQIAIAGAVSSALVAFIANWEGKRNVPYIDAVGVLTVCYGHTGPDIVKDQKYSDAECLSLLREDINEHQSGVLECLQAPVNQNQLDSFTSLAFNIGVSATCNSSPMRLFNDGKYTEACHAFMEYRGAYQRDSAGRRIPNSWREIKGLKLRREAERLWCLTPHDGPRGASLFQLLRDTL